LDQEVDHCDRVNLSSIAVGDALNHRSSSLVLSDHQSPHSRFNVYRAVALGYFRVYHFLWYAVWTVSRVSIQPHLSKMAFAFFSSGMVWPFVQPAP
jgi:hypothetical protein